MKLTSPIRPIVLVIEIPSGPIILLRGSSILCMCRHASLFLVEHSRTSRSGTLVLLWSLSSDGTPEEESLLYSDITEVSKLSVTPLCRRTLLYQVNTIITGSLSKGFVDQVTFDFVLYSNFFFLVEHKSKNVSLHFETKFTPKIEIIAVPNLHRLSVFIVNFTINRFEEHVNPSKLLRLLM